MVTFSKSLFILLTLVSLGMFFFLPASLFAADCTAGNIGGCVGGGNPGEVGGGNLGDVGGGNPGGPQTVQFDNPLNTNDIGEFLTNLLSIIIKVLFPLIVLAVIYSGFLFVTAQGNESKLGDAKRTFFWTVVGALIVLAAQAIVVLVSGTVDQVIK